jgi:enediyne biosynthesis protein E4
MNSHSTASRPITLALSMLLLGDSLFAMPTITRQPSPRTNSVSLGVTLQNRITATTTFPPLRYQWLLNSAPIVGATNTSITLTKVQMAAAGSYTVRVSDEENSVESQSWVVDVDPAFTRITGAQFNIAGGSSGVSWADVNEDGWPDLFIAGKTGSPTLLTNRMDGTLGRASSGITGGIGSAAFADYDNDGHVDLFLAGANALYRGNGKASFARTNINFGALSSFCASWADYDNDGFVDLFAGNYYTGGLNALFRNNGNGSLVKITTNAPSFDRSSSQGVTWTDYDNDGRLDLFVANTGNQKCFLYHNDGAGKFTSITNSALTKISGAFATGAWGDYDNDGWPDLFLCGYKQKHYLFHNDGGSFSVVTNAGAITTDSAEDQSAVWADYDNDGFLDLFVCSGGLASLKDFLYRNNGDGTFEKIVRGSLVNDNGEGAGAAWADFNRDGFPDLFVSNWGNVASGDAFNYLYLNNGNSSAWLGIRCLGRVSNRSAIGAKVRVKAIINGQEVVQLREISGGGYYVSQNALDPLFGLGDATNVISVRVEWPSGIIQEFLNIAPRQFIDITEPPRLKALGIEANEFRFQTQGAELGSWIDMSTDFINWEPVTAINPSAASTVIAIPGHGPAAFFRVHDLNGTKFHVMPRPW